MLRLVVDILYSALLGALGGACAPIESYMKGDGGLIELLLLGWKIGFGASFGTFVGIAVAVMDQVSASEETSVHDSNHVYSSEKLLFGSTSFSLPSKAEPFPNTVCSDFANTTSPDKDASLRNNPPFLVSSTAWESLSNTPSHHGSPNRFPLDCGSVLPVAISPIEKVYNSKNQGRSSVKSSTSRSTMESPINFSGVYDRPFVFESPKNNQQECRTWTPGPVGLGWGSSSFFDGNQESQLSEYSSPGHLTCKPRVDPCSPISGLLLVDRSLECNSNLSSFDGKLRPEYYSDRDATQHRIAIPRSTYPITSDSTSEKHSSSFQLSTLDHTVEDSESVSFQPSHTLLNPALSFTHESIPRAFKFPAFRKHSFYNEYVETFGPPNEEYLLSSGCNEWDLVAGMLMSHGREATIHRMSCLPRYWLNDLDNLLTSRFRIEYVWYLKPPRYTLEGVLRAIQRESICPVVYKSPWPRTGSRKSSGIRTLVLGVVLLRKGLPSQEKYFNLRFFPKYSITCSVK